jgi:dinuclear metal center YbgI/SA1388 family protein
MTTVRELCTVIEEQAPLSLQEKYDNAGLLVGNSNQSVSGVLVCLDVTEAVLDEAIALNCNLVISHHPLIFNGLKQLTGRNEVQRCVMKAVKTDIAIYAAHTNLDNVINGVNGKIAEKLNLQNCRILSPMQNALLKLVTFVPKLLVQKVREALFEAGAGHIGNYDSCSFNVEGYGSFKAGELANPFVGELHSIRYEPEVRVEVILHRGLESAVVKALKAAHPYEEPAFDLIPLANLWENSGAGIFGTLPEAVPVTEFMSILKETLNSPVIRHTALIKPTVQKIAICGGSGSFLISDALAAKVDIFITADLKYHEFMEADGKLVLVDAGHYETEQFTKDLIGEIISKKFPTFAVHISKVTTNPILYL